MFLSCCGVLGRSVVKSAAIVACAAAGSAWSPAFAQSSDATSRGASYSSVVQAWLAFPSVDAVEWPYAYLRADSTRSSAQAKRADLFKELDQLTWRLEDGRHDALIRAIEDWRAELSEKELFREPGDWSPAWLMAHPQKAPPVARVAAIGACEPPDWVEVWDSRGVERAPWRGGLTLSEMSRDGGPIDLHGAEQVALVTPEGKIEHYGQAAYNYADAELSPGTQVVVALPLGGEAFPWIRDTIATVLAHAAPGDNCSEMALAEKASIND